MEINNKGLFYNTSFMVRMGLDVFRMYSVDNLCKEFIRCL